MLYPPELRGHKEYQLVTQLFSPSGVKLCLLVPLNPTTKRLELSFALTEHFSILNNVNLKTLT